MGVEVVGNLEISCNGGARDIGLDGAAQLLYGLVGACRRQMPAGDMSDLLMGMLCGCLGHFADDLPREVLVAQLDLARAMVLDCEAFKPAGQLPAPEGKAVH